MKIKFNIKLKQKLLKTRKLLFINRKLKNIVNNFLKLCKIKFNIKLKQKDFKITIFL